MNSKVDNKLTLIEYTTKIEEIINKARELLSQTDVSAGDLPETIYDKEKPISLVFAGQYSAGKSTILKALTGKDDIPVGEGITTQQTCTYDWKNVKLVDTPGIHTELHPDHDKIAYDAIADADILVYVITNRLFDALIGENFRNILNGKDKAGEMILVVNKMADEGNTPELQKIKQDGLCDVIDPYTPEELGICFIDAESYVDSIKQEDTNISIKLRNRSNINVLIDTLNKFVKNKATTARLTTALYKTDEILDKAIRNFQIESKDSGISLLIENLNQARNIFINNKRRVEQSVKCIVNKAASDIRDMGRKLANDIYDCNTQDDAESMIEKAVNEAECICFNCSDAVMREIEELSKSCEAELDIFYNSELCKKLDVYITEGKDRNLLKQIKKSGFLKEGLKEGGKLLEKLDVHEMVLKIGQFWGKKFKPWEAVKMAKGIEKAAGIFGVIFSLGMQIKEDIDAYKHEQEMRSNREKIRAGFNNAANELKEHIINALYNYLVNGYDKNIEKIDKEIHEIKQAQKGKTDLQKQLEATQNDCRSLIRDIRRNSCSIEDTI